MTDSERLEARILALNLAASLYSNEYNILGVARKYIAFLFDESDYDKYIEKSTTPLTSVKQSKSKKSK
jgi:hypothetical protein